METVEEEEESGRGNGVVTATSMQAGWGGVECGRPLESEPRNTDACMQGLL